LTISEEKARRFRIEKRAAITPPEQKANNAYEKQNDDNADGAAG